MAAAPIDAASRKLHPPPERTESPTIAESHHLVREREFSSRDVPAVLLILRNAHSTGTLLIDLSQGGVGSIRFREEQRVEFTK